MWIGQKIQLSSITYETVSCILNNYTFATFYFIAYRTLQETYGSLNHSPKQHRNNFYKQHKDALPGSARIHKSRAKVQEQGDSL